MILTPLHLDRLSQKIGQEVTTPAGATVLMLDIENVTGMRLGLNTVKRLVGVLPDGNANPRRTTLNTIANYLGYPDWDMLSGDIGQGGSGFFRKNPFIEMAELSEESVVEICWKPDRRLLIRHDGNGQYTVLESDNSKLLPGDLLSMSQLAIGFPFVACKVFRDEKPLGSYQAAQGVGIIRFDILEGEV